MSDDLTAHPMYRDDELKAENARLAGELAAYKLGKTLVSNVMAERRACNCPACKRATKGGYPYLTPQDLGIPPAKPAKAKCKRCGGTGGVIGDKPPYTVTCPDCGGSGEGKEKGETR